MKVSFPFSHRVRPSRPQPRAVRAGQMLSLCCLLLIGAEGRGEASTAPLGGEAQIAPSAAPGSPQAALPSAEGPLAEPSSADSSTTNIPSETASPELFLARLTPRLGNEPASRLRMRFEVTFMKIDVADLEARVAPPVSSLIQPIVLGGERDDEAEGRIADLLMDPSSPILLTMTYLRDSDYDRFRKGLRISMEQAAASGAISESDRTELTDVLVAKCEPLADAGVAKGGVLAHYIDGTTVRTLYLDPEGRPQLDTETQDERLGRALRASWFGKESRFREKLLRSLFP